MLMALPNTPSPFIFFPALQYGEAPDMPPLGGISLPGYAPPLSLAQDSRACSNLSAWWRVVRRYKNLGAPTLAQSAAGCPWLHYRQS
jgi:hypothetical protein